MKQSEVTQQQFAEWSFERDQSIGIYPGRTSLADLPEDEQNQYQEEAAYYLNEHPKDDWPKDIMVRLEP